MAVMVASTSSSNTNVANTNNANRSRASSQRRHSISTSTLSAKHAFPTMADYTPLKRMPLAPPASSFSSATRLPLPMPTPSASSAASPSARKMAAELRRHSFRLAATSRAPTTTPVTATTASTSTPSTLVSSARSPVKVLCAASASTQIQHGFTSTTASTKPLSHKPSSSAKELPILRFHYVARDVRVAIGPSWKLQRFEVKSLRLQTGAQPTLFIFSTSSQSESFKLPADTTCSVQNGVGLKLKSRMDSHVRVRVRFATAADASIWSRLIQDSLDHAKWLREYEEVQCLKQDPNSRVVVMRSVLTKQERVVKVLPNVRLDRGDCEEVRILKRLLPLAHRYESLEFLSDYRVVETLHDVHIVMPKHTGKTLLQFLSERPRPQVLHEHEARSVVVKMCETLQALHNNDIVHCDLKLENVLLSADAKHVCVIDFGGAYDLALPNDQQPNRKMVGTPGYIAPERILSVEEPPMPSADLFSLGIILYQVLVGQHPFGKAQAARRRLTIEDSLTLDWSHMQRRLRERNVSEEAQRLVAQLVEANPQKRISLDQVLSHEWITNQCS